jgi:alcohol dehydrogenase class IV
MEYPVGVAVHCSHGRGNAVLLPHVMRYNLPPRRQTFARIASLLGQDTSRLTTDEAAELAIQKVSQLNRDIGIPSRLSHLAVQEEMLPEFAKKAFEVKRVLRVNPRQPTMEDILSIYQQAL